MDTEIVHQEPYVAEEPMIQADNVEMEIEKLSEVVMKEAEEPQDIEEHIELRETLMVTTIKHFFTTKMMLTRLHLLPLLLDLLKFQVDNVEETLTEIKEDFTLILESCKVQVDKRKKGYDYQDDPDYHKGKKLQLIQWFRVVSKRKKEMLLNMQK
ncbi:hypothetical protein L6452_05919 [Arctium lappa]|uniref:Uncharacterized protein n=1 Tax=Arctium lappa TaxID=4217 RepID=A0ACB9EHE9_ARCLA|nr:hypothetical protein L6452_05919 [Arctium lappa]